MIGLIDAVLVYAMIPIIKLYFGVSILNGLTGEDRFAGMEELIKNVTSDTKIVIVGSDG